ncbi:glycosyltransferase 87 family protein [Eubacterium sp. MSJ-33]|uniref:glycosyltransferase 87 family protein n=1 Tax=Eubacterium sp. MSJ-33 TaxID=2841528 RepID=UPI001C756E67|nr:glycosyltransferase 87 family protein [Eubacterium sp. MSJ-33]QWT53233.1 DUF2029 domain-containing protein [Eubacterium sp. MSJ-33]
MTKKTKLDKPSQNQLLLLFGIIIICSFLVWICAIIISPEGMQRSLFFLEMKDFWADGTNTTGLASIRNPYLDDSIGLENAAYPPLAYDLFYLLAHASKAPSNGYLDYYYQPLWTMIFTIAIYMSVLLIYIVNSRQFNDGNKGAILACVAILLSRPMLYTIERGNILIIAVVAICVFIYYYDSADKLKKEIAILCLAIAAAIKLTPALLGILLIYKKDWKAAMRTLIYGILFFVVPFFFLQGGIHNLSQMLKNVQAHVAHYSYVSSGTGLIESINKYGKMIFGGGWYIKGEIRISIELIKNIICIVLLLGGSVIKEKWKKVLNVVVVLLIYPSVSGQYCLLYLIPFTVLFFRHTESVDNVKSTDYIITGCLIMVYFMYRCWISEILDYNFAIPVLSIVALYFSIKELKGFLGEYNKGRIEQNQEDVVK